MPSIAEFWSSFLSIERNPPLYHLILRGWIGLVGSADDFLLRLPSALFGLAAVGTAGFIGRQLGGRSRAVLVAGMLAGSPFFVLYMRMARYYALTLLLALVATALFLVATAGPRRDRAWLAYGLAAAGVMLTAYTALAVVVGHQVWFLATRGWRRAGWRPWLTGMAVAGLPVLGWLTVAATRIPGFAQQPAPQMPQGLKGMLLDLAYPLYAYSLGETIFPWHPAALLGLVGLAIATVAGLRRWRKDLAVRFGVVMFAVTFGIAWLSFQLFVQDLPFVTLAVRSVFSLPFLVLIWTAGLASLPRWPGRAVAGLIAVGMIASLGNYFSGSQFHNPIYVVPTKEIVAQVAASARPDDLILTDRDSEFGYYYGAPPGGPRHLYTSETGAAIAAAQAQPQARVWLLTLGRDRTQGETRVVLIDWLESHRRRSATWGFAPQDPTYRRLKEQILGYPAYEHKAVLSLYEPEGSRQ